MTDIKLSNEDKKLNLNLDSSDTRNKILKYLASVEPNYNRRFNEVITDADLEELGNGDYVICPKYSGVRSWAIICMIDDIHYSVNFPKFTKFNKNSIVFHEIGVSATKLLHMGTVMEGIYYEIEDDFGKRRFFTVDEVYMLAGSNELIKTKDDRLKNLHQMLSIHTRVKAGSDFTLNVCQCYNTDPDSLKHVFDRVVADEHIQELIFYPKLYSQKIYSYALKPDDVKEKIVEVETFLMQKTSKTDVYILYVENDDGTKTKIGFAGVPNITASKTFAFWFKSNKAKELIVDCQRLSGLDKWVPFKIIS
jgi:hypothetical protein